MGTNSDGTVSMSFLYNSQVFNRNNLGDSIIKQGWITKAYSPKDKNNLSKKFMEYDVTVLDYVNGKFLETEMYKCKTISTFGGIADYCRYTPRLTTDKEGYVTGSQVFVFCGSGDKKNGYILGGLPHALEEEVDTEFKESPYFEWEFNGIKADINKLGELTVSRKGPTQDNGEVTDKNQEGAGALFTLSNEGNILLGQKDESIFFEFNKKDKKFTLKAEGEISSTTDKSFFVTTKDGVHINPDTKTNRQDFLNATSYRQSETELHSQNWVPSMVQMEILLGSLVSSLTTATVSFASAGAAMAAPIAGAVIAAPLVVAASVGLGLAVKDVVALTAELVKVKLALTQFEGKTTQYLSKKHDFAD